MITGLMGCRDKAPLMSKEHHEIVVRLANEPDRLNPLTTRSATANNILEYLYLPLAQFDPQTMVLKPVLLEALPEAQTMEQGDFAGDIQYDFVIRKEAVWSDGYPVTGLDYLFTLKAAFNPRVPAAAWRGVLQHILDVQIDKQDPKKFTVIVDGDYMLAREVAVNFNVLPRHIFDASNLLASFSLQQLKASDPKDTTKALMDFAKGFSTYALNREQRVSSGGYQLADWNTKQEILLERNNDWWGNQIRDTSHLFDHYPDRIRFVIIPDETVAITALKDGKVDVMAQVNPDIFDELKQDEQVREVFDFFSPAVMQYYYISLNTTDAVLSDGEVRKSLRYALDVPELVDKLMHGLAVPVVGPYHPSKAYYNSRLKPIQKDLSKASAILKDDGWEDTNHNGILDKSINGRFKELTLEILITKKELGRQLALLLQSAAKNIGIDIKVVQKDWSTILKKLRQKDYQMVVMAGRHHVGLSDPYQTWHSDNAVPGGTNMTGFGTEKSDQIIEKIRTTKDSTERVRLYQALQEIIYQEQPMLFLFAPTERIVVNKRWSGESSVRRPGYFVNSFKPNF